MNAKAITIESPAIAKKNDDEEHQQIAEPAQRAARLDAAAGTPMPSSDSPGGSTFGVPRSRRNMNVGMAATRKKTAVIGPTSRTRSKFSSV